MHAQAGISGEVTRVSKEASAEELSQKLWEEQTFEGWDDVFRTNVSSGECTSCGSGACYLD